MSRLSEVPRLIHLNGPPGIGKSTLSQMYADEHPGTLNLDIDRVRELIGGWRDQFTRAGQLVRPLAFTMARTHLESGHDVVMPQYLGRLSEVERFEGAAHVSGAHFREVVLMDTKDASLERFYRRHEGDELPWHHQVQAIVERQGGRTLLAAMYDSLEEVRRSRPEAVVVPSRAGHVTQTYKSLCAALTAMG